MEKEGLVARATDLEQVLQESARSLANHEAVHEVRVGGFMAGVQVREQIQAARVADRCIELGVAMRAINDNTLQVCPPLIVNADEVRLILAVIAQALDLESA